MLLAIALAAVSAWVPARWPTGDPSSLDLVQGTRINCLLLESPHWSPAFSAKAAQLGIATLGVVRPGADLDGEAKRARQSELQGLVLEGDFDSQPDLKGLTIVSLPSRSNMRFDDLIVGSSQGVWPGVNQVDEQHAKAAPSGAPWLDTNSGFLRFARAMTNRPIWIANTPPPYKIYKVERYLQAIAEAAMCGARWVIALDTDFSSRLARQEAPALADWKRITGMLEFVESNADQSNWGAAGELTLIQDPSSGALLSGGILDMIAVKHTPVRLVPQKRLSAAAMKGSSMTVNVNPGGLTEEQRQILVNYTKAGGTVLTGPPGWQFPTPRAGQITLDEKELEKLDAIWKELNTMTGRRNLGARLFNVSSMLSNLTATPDGQRQLLHLVNYTDFPVESITVHVLGKWKQATILQPGAAPQKLEVYPVEEGPATGVDIPLVGSYALLLIEP